MSYRLLLWFVFFRKLFAPFTKSISRQTKEKNIKRAAFNILRQLFRFTLHRFPHFPPFVVSQSTVIAVFPFCPLTNFEERKEIALMQKTHQVSRFAYKRRKKNAFRKFFLKSTLQLFSMMFFIPIEMWMACLFLESVENPLCKC